MKRSKKEEPNQEEEQLNLGLKEPISNRYFSVKQRIFKRVRIIETRKYLKSGNVWILLILSATLIGVQLYYIFKYNDSLPTIIPLFKHFTNLQFRLTQSENIYFIPMLSTLILATAILSGYRTHNRKPTLSTFNLLSAFFSLIMLTISIINIFALYNG